MLKFSNSLSKEETDIVLCDLISRLRFYPAVYEIRTGEIFRIDAINTNEYTFHVLNGEEYDWYSIGCFKPILYPLASVYSSYSVDNSCKAAYNLIRNILLDCDMEFDEKTLNFTSLGNESLPLNIAMDILEVLNYRFIDYRNLIDSGLAIDVNKLDKSPYRNRKKINCHG